MNADLLKKIDATVGGLLARLLPRPRWFRTDAIQKILVIRPGGIGDALLLIPTITRLKAVFPGATLDVLAEERNVSAFALCVGVSHTLCYHKPGDLLKAIRGRYDLVIDSEQWHRLSAVVTRLCRARMSIGFATNQRMRLFSHPVSYSHDEYEVDSFRRLLDPLRLESLQPNEVPFLKVPESARRSVDQLLSGGCQSMPVVLFPGASIAERRWGTERFRAVALKLNEQGQHVVVVGGHGDRAEGEKIVAGGVGVNLAGRTSLPETAAIIERSALLITGDSGMLHLAVGLGRPTVSLFGPGIANKWAPRGGGHRVLNRHLDCSPCTRYGYTPSCQRDAQCMKQITVQDVLTAAESSISLIK